MENRIAECFDTYGDFMPSKYYILHYEGIPSGIRVEVPLVTNKKNTEKALALIQCEEQKLIEIFKRWKTSSYQEGLEKNQDYPNYIFYSSQVSSLTLEIKFDDNEATLTCLYNNTDSETEEWIFKTINTIRNKLGKPKSPAFKVLTQSHGSFYAEDVNIDNFTIDLAANYNDDFLEINDIIDESMSEESSGLVLLHGQPGTGKTSYIKHLLSKHNEVDFIFVQNDFVNELIKPDFITFLINHKNSVLIIEDAEKVILSREKENSNSVVSTILQLTDGLFSDYLNIKIICTFNTDKKNIDEALLRKGRMIAFYEFKELKAKKVDAILESKGLAAQGKDMTLAELFNIQRKEFGGINTENTIGFNRI